MNANEKLDVFENLGGWLAVENEELKEVDGGGLIAYAGAMSVAIIVGPVAVAAGVLLNS